MTATMHAEHPLYRWRWMLAAYVVAFSVLDLTITQHVLAHSSHAEGNPIMAPFVMSWWAWPVRVGLPALIVSRDMRKGKYGPIAFAATLYGFVVAWNFHVMAGL